MPSGRCLHNQKALGRCNRQGSKHELDSAQQSLTNIIQKNPELVTLKISVYKLATATWLLRYWPICRRCCRVLAAQKQEQTWEISTWLSKHCQPALKSCECHCLSHVMSWCVASKKRLFTSDVLWYWSSRRSSFIQTFPHLPPQQSSCEQIYNEYAELPDHKSQGIVQ